MIETIAVIFIVIILLTIFMFLSLKRIVTKVGEETRSYFVMKLQSYDELIEEKEKKLAEIKSDTKELVEARETLETTSQTNVVIAKDAPKFQYEGLGEIIKQVENNFNYDYEKIVNQFLKVAKSQNNNGYDEAVKLKEKILEKGLYTFIILSDVEQTKIIEELGYANSIIYKQYFENYKKFNINNFIKVIDIYLVKNDPHVFITTSEKNKTFDNFDDLIITNKDKQIIKGIKVLFKGKIYDFSLS